MNGQDRRVILIIEPHPDDGILSMGGNILLYHKNNDQLISLVMFSETNEMGEIRKKESNLVWETMLNSKVIYADLPDEAFDTFMDGSFKITRKSKEILLKAVNIITENISENKPDIVYFPIGIGEHFHHLLINMCFKIIYDNFRNIEFYFYEDYPYSDYGRVTYSKQVYYLFKKYKIQKVYKAIDEQLQDKVNCFMVYQSQNKKTYDEIYKIAETYGMGIGYEGLLENYPLVPECTYERTWKVYGYNKEGNI